ncbi:MAG: hypothetical protein JSR73_10335 [Proteobacteria bacterium]|nr:hypothetical protein [Pseudomonadota bacterium]
MTLRDYLRRQVWIGYAIMIAGWLGLPLSLALSGEAADIPQVAFFAVAGVLVGVLWLVVRVRCPKCKARYGQIATEIAFGFGRRQRVMFCPYCGERLDQPYEPPRRVL